GSARTVTWSNNPSLASGFMVVVNFVVGNGVTLNHADGVAGIGSTTANYFLIENNAKAVFTASGYTCPARLVFKNGSDTGTDSSGTLRLENSITQFAGSLTAGIGTVEYAGNGVNQTV